MTETRASLPPFQALLDEHAQAVHAFLRGMVGPDDAEDCLQETFLAALRAYPRAEPANLRAWIFTIARRKAIDHHRAATARPVPVADPGELAPAEASDAPPIDGRGSALWSAVAGLPPKQRAAVVLRFAVDMRYREIADAMGTTEEAARRNVHEALRKLRASAHELKEAMR